MSDTDSADGAKTMPKGGGKREHIVAHDVFLCKQTGKQTFVADKKCFWKKKQKFFDLCCVLDTNFVSTANVHRAGKQGNICVRNNVSLLPLP